MGLISRRNTRLVLAALALLAVAAAVDGTLLLRKQAHNRDIETGRVPADGTPALRELRFAQAHAAAASAPGGISEAALNRYRALQGEDPLGQAARFNTANLLLRQAVAMREASQAGQALPLIELAKETLREVLRHDPQHWAARYNLERAQRLLPDPDDGDNEAPPPPSQAERAATTMRGYSPGLP
jgi:mxaK protein